MQKNVLKTSAISSNQLKRLEINRYWIKNGLINVSFPYLILKSMNYTSNDEFLYKRWIKINLVS